MTAKGKAKLARLVAIQKIALKFIGRNVAGHRLNDGPEVIKYKDAVFLIMFYVRDPVPVESRRKFNLGPLFRLTIDRYARRFRTTCARGGEDIGDNCPYTREFDRYYHVKCPLKRT